MKRSEFQNEMQGMWDLHSFCVDKYCDILMDMWDGEGFSCYIDEQLVDYARNDDWRDLLSRLQEYEDLIERYDYIVYDQSDYEYVGVDDRDFDTYYRDILEWGDDVEIWDEEDEEEEEEDDGNPPLYSVPGYTGGYPQYGSCCPPSPEPDEDEEADWDFAEPDCSFDDLCRSGAECVSAVRSRAERERQEWQRSMDSAWANFNDELAF